MLHGIRASYGFPAADQSPRYVDIALGSVDRLASWNGWISESVDPLIGPETPHTLRINTNEMLYATLTLVPFIIDLEPIEILSTSPGTGLALDGIALILLNPTGWPDSTTGLTAGDVWANGIFVNAVPGSTPDPLAPPVFFGTITAPSLLALGAGDLPLVDPLVLNQLWLNGVQICVSAGPGPSTGLALDGIAVILLDPAGWPDSTAGLPDGAVWANGFFVNAVPGSTPDPGAPPVFFGSITSAALLALGAGNLPLVDPLAPGQLWLNGVQVCVSAEHLFILDDPIYGLLDTSGVLLG